jgi:hypothetical protein
MTIVRLDFKDTRTGVSKEIDFPLGIALPKTGDEIISSISGVRVTVTELAGGGNSPLQVQFSE